MFNSINVGEDSQNQPFMLLQKCELRRLEILDTKTKGLLKQSSKQGLNIITPETVVIP